MLAKQNRLTKAEYNEVFKRAKVTNSSSFLVRRANVTGRIAFSVVIPKKVYPLSTDRNELRRSIYDSIGKRMPKYKVDCIFIAKPEIKAKKKEEIDSEVSKLLENVLVEVNSKIS